MIKRLNPLQAFLAELKRRRVFRVAVVYGATAFVVIEAADLIFPRLGLPDWTVTLVVALIILGAPFAFVLAWAYEMTPEGVKRTDPAAFDELEAIVSEPAARRWPAGVAALIAVALLIAAAWLTLGRRFISDDATPVARPTVGGSAVAVLPFSVQGSSDLEYLEGGMVNLLSTKLDGAGDLRSVDPRTLLRYVERESLAAGDPAVARGVANAFGAGYYVVGDIVEAGGRIQLAAALYDIGAGREPLAEGVVGGAAELLFELVDDLAARLLSGLSGGPAARVRRIAAVTTTSLPALKSFFEGEELFRRAQFGAAVDAFRDAVEADSTFALAWYRLSLTAEWNLQDDLAHGAAEQAVRFDQRLSDRDRRMLEVFLKRRQGANDEAEEDYRSILGTYPDEMEAWLDLAEVLFHAGPLSARSITESREAMEHVLAFDPNHSTALIHLSRVAAYERSLVELDSLVERFRRLNPSPERSLELEALLAFTHRDSARVEATMARLAGAEDLGVALAVWAAAVYAQNIEGAERVAGLLTADHRSPEARRLGYAWLAHTKLAAGRWRDAQKQLDRLAELSEGSALEYEALLSNIPFVPVDEPALGRLYSELERFDPASITVSENPSIVFTAHDRLHPFIRLYLLGLTSARLGRADEAERYAARVMRLELPRTAGSLAEDGANSIRSQVLATAGREGQALVELEAAQMRAWYGQTLASPLYCRAFERFARAELLRGQGREREALRWYATMVQSSAFELPYLAMSHLRQGEIYDSLGALEQASEHYSRFVALWELADAEFQPLVTKARERLEAISGGG